jgi:hypothetical protein
MQACLELVYWNRSTSFFLFVHLLETTFYLALGGRLHLKGVLIQLPNDWKKKLDH